MLVNHAFYFIVGDTQQTISISSNNTVTNQDIQSPEISQQQMRFSSTSAITEPDSLDTSIIDSLDVLQQTDASNLIDSIEIPPLIDTINEYEQGLQSNQKHSKEFIAAECSDSSKQQEKPLTERNEMQVESNLEEASFEGALEQLIRSVNETLVLNDSSLNNVLIKDLQPDLQSNKELNHNSDTTAIVSETQTDTTPKNPAFHQSSSDSINKSNETHDTSHNPTKSMPQELSDGILAESQTTQQNLDQFSEKNTGIDDQSCASPNQYEQPQPTTSQEKQFTAANNLTETNTDETPLDNNESPVNKNVDDETDTTDIAYERQETKEFEKLEELAANTEDTSSSKFEINDILDYLVAKSTSPTHETEQELQVEPEQKLNKQPPIEAVPLGLLQEIATLPLPDDDDSPLETNKTFFRQDTGEFEAIEKQCLLDVQNEKKLSEVPEENSSKAMEGEAVKQTNELESKLVAKNCEETAVESPTRDVLEETKTNGEKNVSENIKNDVVKSAQSEIDQSEAILLDLMAEKFIVLPAQHFEGKTPVQEVSKTLCRQDTHEFEIMEKQCMLEAQKEQNSDKLDKVSEILEDVNKIKDGVNDSSSSSADTVIAVNESNKTGVTEEVIIQHNNEHLDKNYLNNKTLTEEVVKESSVKTSAGNNSQIEGFTKLLVANEREISQEGKPCENKNCVLDTSFHSSAAINAQNTSQDYDQEKKVSENPQVTSYNDTQIAQIAKDCKSQDEVILKQSHKCLSKGEPSGFSNATNDAQPTITDKEISSDNVLNDKVESNDVVTLENDANQVDSRKSPSVKPQFNKQNRKSETRNKAEVRPTVRANKPIPTQKIASQNDNLCKDHPVTDHEDSAAKVTNSSQCDETNIVSKMK